MTAAALTLPGVPGATGSAMECAAWISTDGVYRYTLDRRWDAAKPCMRVMMLNPSTADQHEDDATVAGLIRKAKHHGFGRLHIVNLFAFRATDPRELLTAPDPVGQRNDALLVLEAAQPGPMLVGWGAPANAEVRRLTKIRALKVLGFFAHSPLVALGVTASGEPRHPLYMRDDAPLSAWPEETT